MILDITPAGVPADPQARHSAGDSELTYRSNPILPARSSGNGFAAGTGLTFVQLRLW